MGRKCTVWNCSTNYESQKGKQGHITVYGFPSDPVEQHKWVRSLPNVVSKVSDHIGICALHWPADTPLQRKGRYSRPILPPSIFPGAPESSISTVNLSTPWSTKKSSSSARAVDIDEMSGEHEKLKRDTFLDDLRSKVNHVGLLAAADRDTIVMFSPTREGPVPSYFVELKLAENEGSFAVEYEAYHKLKRIYHPQHKIAT